MNTRPMTSTAIPGPTVAASPWRQHGLTLAVFALPALSLSVPSGYSWAGLLLCLWGLLHWTRLPPAPNRRVWWVWGGTLVAMGLMWALDAVWAEPFRVNILDRPAKFLLVLLALPVGWSLGAPQAQAFRHGTVLGACAAAAVAAFQLHVLGMDRAWGHTNAILFGDLALLLGLWCWLWTRHDTGWPHVLGWVGALAGGYASILSEARGGWLMAPVLWLMVMVLDHPPRAHTLPRQAGRMQLSPTVVALGAALLLLTQWDVLSVRAQRAWDETVQHQTTGVSNTSVGQRLAHWKLAWQLGSERPWTGWTEDGYQVEKAARVARGEAPAVLNEFKHAHNELLDMWAKRGLPGVLALVVLMYGVPATLYAQALRRWRQTDPTQRPPWANRAALTGLTLVVGYMGFGLTQVMFAHNSGTMVYLFMNLVLLGLVNAAPASHPPRPGPARG
ncbi:O-antigen ligase family protein [Hydrogenophaga soli]